ncbi:hypothetical protein [uncultured Roseivirga sp.]|uniref:hypothetical protein n=1 Tax=uncultured Roseivirga sp. TaxID=543088 RepID=UPI0030D818AA|tara:strand:+ start:58872 stop:59948 length:1077 start_codon:yes stop_codon:yes gene_type:complete
MQYFASTGFPSILTDLPNIYKDFFPDFFNSGIPEESLATCNNCAMVCKDKERDVSKLTLKPFHPDKKCCTYHPSLPSYLVGGALLEASLEGKRSLRKAISKKTGVTPYGILTPNFYNTLYSNQSGGFGSSETLLCPYFLKESGNCSIWKFRESVCSTYFCKTLAGEKGKKFWGSLKGYLNHVEQSLSQYIAIKAGLNYYIANSSVYKIQKSPLTTEELDGLPPTDYVDIWGEWYGRESDFYIWAYEQISRLTSKEFEDITGIRQKVLLEGLKAEHKKVLTIPEHLSVNEHWKPKNGEQIKKIRFSTIDIQFELPSEVLHSFDGKKNISEAKKALEDISEIEIEDSMILSLYHYGVLEE